MAASDGAALAVGAGATLTAPAAGSTQRVASPQVAGSPETRVDFVPYGSAATPPWGTPLPPARPEQPPRRRHSRWTWLWLPLMVVLIGGITFDIVASWQKRNATVVVPPWSNASFETASAAAHRLGFTVHRVNADSTTEAGTVLSTSPAQGSHLKKGSIVTLTVSLGNQVHIDSVVSAMEPAAASTLQGQGLKVAQSPDHNSTAPANQVTGQDPPAGAVATKGDTVTLTVSAPLPVQPVQPAQPGPTACSGLSQFLSQLGIGSCDAASSDTPPPDPGKHHHGGGNNQ